MPNKTSSVTVQKWGNSLAIRIPAPLARSAHFCLGTPVQLAVQDSSIVIKMTGDPRLSLQERLNLFDPDQHGGEVMSSGLEGVEKFE